MTITQTQADVISGYLQRIGFQGHIFDPNDHDESVHLISIPPSQPFWIFSFKPSTSPRVINGGNMFTYGVAADSFDAIVTSWDRNVNESTTIIQGMKTLKPEGLVFLCVEGEVAPTDRALFARAKVEFVTTLETYKAPNWPEICTMLCGVYKGGLYASQAGGA